MTDKQIIIDDQKKTIHRLQDECTEKTNIIIALGEQLKAKEQIIEKLKETYLACYKAKHEDIEGKLFKLKAENEELKEEIKTKTYHWEQCTEEILKGTKQFVDRMEKAEKTLTEIKEICNNNDELKGDFNLVDCDKYKLGKHNLANRILQKISECEGKQ